MTTFITDEDFNKFDKADIISLVVGSISKVFPLRRSQTLFVLLHLITLLYDKLKYSCLLEIFRILMIVNHGYDGDTDSQC